MKVIKRKTILLFSLIILLVTQLHAQKNVTILYTNDIESVYEPIEAFWNDDIELIGGIPYLATLIKETRQKEKTSFLFDAGDIFTGALSAATKGELPFDVYSSIGYDAICLGNHEFEYGWERLDHVKQRGRFPVLNCNIFYEGTDIHFAQSYTILEKDNIRIGLIGLMGIDAFKNTINPAHREGLEVRDPYPIVQKIVDEIRNEVDLVVVLTHENASAPMQIDKEADPEVQRGFDEDYALAGQLKGVDIIFGGHSDNGLWQPVKHPKTGTLIGLTFGQGKYLGYLNLTLNKNGVEVNEGKLIPVESKLLKPDEKVTEMVQNVRNEHKNLTEVLGTIDDGIYRKYYRESLLGDWFADMLKNASNADIALVHSGSLRSDLNAGDITTEEVINIYPFINQYYVVEIDGNALKTLLEYSYQLNYGIAQLSGVNTTYNSKKPVGQRLITAEVNGKPIENNQKYTLACAAFLANGGDGYSMLKAGKLISKSQENLIDVFVESIKKQNHVTIPNLGRQVDVSRR